MSPTSERAIRGGGAALLLLLAVALAAGWWTKARCLTDGDGWINGEQYLGWCYTDVYPLWYAEKLDQGATPYLDHPVEYPVLTGAEMWLADAVGRVLPGETDGGRFFHVTAAFGAGLLAWTFLLLRGEGLSRERLLRFVLAPTLVVYAFMNWDPLAVALCTAGLVAHRRGRDVEAGVFAGLGTAAKLFPGLLVPVVFATRWAQGRRRAAFAHAGSALGAWLAVNVPWMVVAPTGWRRFVDLSRERGADWDSLWLFADRLGWLHLDVGALNLASLLVFLGGAMLISWLGGRRRDPERWWELLLPLLAWFLLANKVYSPQFSLWLLPLMALALPSTPAFVAFAATDLMVFLVRFPYLGHESGVDPGPGYPLFAAALLLRAAALCWVIVSAVRGDAGDQPPRRLVGSSVGSTASPAVDTGSGSVGTSVGSAVGEPDSVGVGEADSDGD